MVFVPFCLNICRNKGVKRFLTGKKIRISNRCKCHSHQDHGRKQATKGRLSRHRLPYRIWNQHKGFRCQVSGEIQPDRTIHQLGRTLPFPQLTASGVLVLVFSAPVFSLIHLTCECIQCVTDTTFYRPQDPLRPYSCYCSPCFPLNPET